MARVEPRTCPLDAPLNLISPSANKCTTKERNKGGSNRETTIRRIYTHQGKVTGGHDFHRVHVGHGSQRSQGANVLNKGKRELKTRCICTTYMVFGCSLISQLWWNGAGEEFQCLPTVNVTTQGSFCIKGLEGMSEEGNLGIGSNTVTRKENRKTKST